jgi:hypothetical protein
MQTLSWRTAPQFPLCIRNVQRRFAGRLAPLAQGSRDISVSTGGQNVRSRLPVGQLQRPTTLQLGFALSLQPPRKLLGRPVQDQFTRDDLSQPPVQGQKALLGPQVRFLGLVIRFMGSISRTATMACDLPTHRRGGSIQVSSDLTNRRAGSNPARDVLALSPCEG